MKVIYIPLDERPCNYYFAGRIASGSEVQVVSPEPQALGCKKTPADFTLLKEFLLKNAEGADAFVISLDMLLYGGIVPSRLHQLCEQELTERLGLLDSIKQINPKAKIYAFALIMRCPKYSSADEEPDYYEYCGREIFLTGQVKHKLQLGLIDEGEAQRLLDEYSAVIKGNLEDFENRRRINRNMLVKVVEKLHKSIDFLVIPQDDSAKYGYTSIDREVIKQALRDNGLDDVAMYPGADEVGMTLLSRAACEYKGVSPKVYPKFAHENCPMVTPLYEDRPVGQTLPFQIESAGCVITDSYDDADVILYLNYPSCEPVEVTQEKSRGYDERHLKEFISEIQSSVKNGRVTALADCAYCNGGDRELLSLLSQEMDILSLSAYAGWNTSSNTLGTVICQAAFVHLFGDSPEQRKFRAERICEDVGYCGYTRSFVTANILPDMGFNYFDAGEKNGAVAAKVREVLLGFVEENFPGVAEEYEISVCQMPWKRMFEVDLSLEEKRG